MPLAREILSEDSPKLKALRHRDQVIRARKSIEAFVSFVFKWKLQKFQKHWHDFANKHKRALIFAPQEHGKTTNMSLIRPLWLLGHNPNKILKVISCNDDKAVDILGVVSKLIQHNKKLREVFPHLRPAERASWTKHQITVKRDFMSAVDASMEALGILSTGSGDRATDLMFDDPVDFRNAIYQPALRKMVTRSYTATWLGLLVKGGRVTYICNAWHHNDLTHEIKKPNYHYRILNQAISKDFKSIEEWFGVKKRKIRRLPTWGSEWPTKRLIETFEERKALDFNRAFRHEALESGMFPFTPGLKKSTVVMEEDAELEDLDAPQDFPRFSGVDLGGVKKQNAQSSIFTLALDPETLTRWPVDIRAGHWTGPETARQLLEVYKEHQPFDIFVENNAYQHTLAEWMEEIKGGRELPIEGYYTGAQKLDLQIGLPSIALQMEKALWKIPDFKHGTLCKCEVCQWREELSSHPIGSSDILMAMWLADRAARRGEEEPNIRFIGGDEDDEEDDEVFEGVLSNIF